MQRIIKTYRIRPALSDRADNMARLAGMTRSEYDQQAIAEKVKRDEKATKPLAFPPPGA